MIRVLVIDDSTFVRKAIRRVLEEEKDIQVVGEASDGSQALERIRQLNPDVVTLDVQMPVQDGYKTLVQIMRQAPRPVIMLSSQTRPGAETTLRCLDAGAVDFVDKGASTMAVHALGEQLRGKVRAASASRFQLRAKESDPETFSSSSLDIQSFQEMPQLLVFGASTGGPPLLQSLLTGLSANFPIPIVVVQHMPEGFTRYFAQRLDGLCRVHVFEAREGATLRPGQAVIAAAGKHLRFAQKRNELALHLSDHPEESVHIPSIDETMRSAALTLESRVVAFLLSGMGSDGAEGLAALRSAGGRTIVQSPGSCVVFGMPRAALHCGAAQHVLSPEQMKHFLEQLDLLGRQRVFAQDATGKHGEKSTSRLHFSRTTRPEASGLDGTRGVL